MDYAGATFTSQGCLILTVYPLVKLKGGSMGMGIKQPWNRKVFCNFKVLGYDTFTLYKGKVEGTFKL